MTPRGRRANHGARLSTKPEAGNTCEREKLHTYAHTHRQSIECIYHIEKSWEGVQSEALGAQQMHSCLPSGVLWGQIFFGCSYWTCTCRHKLLQRGESKWTILLYPFSLIKIVPKVKRHAPAVIMRLKFTGSTVCCFFFSCG